MTGQMLKLKQASAVLQVEPKELQNLVQFGVVKPSGTRTSVLSKLMDAFSDSEEKLKAENPSYVVFTCRIAPEEEPTKLGIPFRALEEQIEERMSRADLYRDLPGGGRRRGWKKEFLESLTEAAKDVGEVSEDEILRVVRGYRRGRRCPEITVAAES